MYFVDCFGLADGGAEFATELKPKSNAAGVCPFIADHKQRGRIQRSDFAPLGVSRARKKPGGIQALVAGGGGQINQKIGFRDCEQFCELVRIAEELGSLADL